VNYTKEFVQQKTWKLDLTRNSNGIWINSKAFSYTAQHFEKYGYYTEYPRKTPEWYEFWDEELRRCVEGYEVGGARITGHHYFYLNFSRIWDKSKKRYRFPDFWDYDYNYFWFIEIARDGMSEEAFLELMLEVTPNTLDGGKDLIVVKARQKGYSFKQAAIATNIYNTVKGAHVLVAAYDKAYLYPKGPMRMVEQNMDFLNTHTPWAKRRIHVNSALHRRASFDKYVNGVKTTAGYLSEVEGRSFKDNPDKGRGLQPHTVFFEESGKFPGLKKSYKAVRPALWDGMIKTGQAIIFGTGGDMERGGSQDLHDMYYSPNQWGLLPFPNIWDGGAGSCGLFVPDYMNKKGAMDENGNSDVEKATEYENGLRAEILEEGGTGNSLSMHLSEHPFKPSEAFLIPESNFFPTDLLREQKARIDANDLYRLRGQAVELQEEEGVVKSMPDLEGKLTPLTSFNLTDKKHREGCVVIYEYPQTSEPGVYIIGYDPFRHSQGESLGAAYVYKTARNLSTSADTIVASYVGRPSTAREFEETLLLLAKLYNARIMHENEITATKNFFLDTGHIEYLMEQPDNVIKYVTKSSKVQRGHGVHISTNIREAAERYTDEWLKEKRGVDEEGNTIRNLNYIYDVALLEELIGYTREGNYDRVSAFFMLMVALQEDRINPPADNSRAEAVAKELQDLKRLRNGSV
jgi:hypothetical protein